MPGLIELVISPQGEITLNTKGYAGPACQEASRFLEEALGIVTQERKTSAFYQAAVLEQHLRQ